MNPTTIKIVLILALAGGLVGTGWTLRGWKYAKDNEAAQKAVNVTNESNIKLLETKDENLKTVESARRDLAGVRLRLHNCQANATPASGVADPRILSDRGQDALDAVAIGFGELALEADKIVEGCRLINSWAR